MKVEIWSDVVCPFCYIGKRKFENALKDFNHKDKVEVEWKSFQLDPESKYVPGKSVYEVLAGKYGRSVEWAKQANENMTRNGKEVGLEYNFDIAKPANTFDAHRLIHLASKHGKQDQAEEALFAAYFTEGKNISDLDTLVEIGTKKLGLDETEIRHMLTGTELTEEVRKDEYEAQVLGVRGVPFFVINRKYAVSGAQPTEVFKEVLEKVWEEESPLQHIAGSADNSCTDDSCAI
jgi:predicted DsbA family dithiol-disulfide isomerase